MKTISKICGRFKIKNDKGHWLIFDSDDQFLGSCDTEELTQTLQELEKELS